VLSGGEQQMLGGDVIKFGIPRKDLHVTLDGVEIKPGLALGSWAAFKQDGGSAMVMGDLVLTEDEVEPVMMKLQEGGIHESANPQSPDRGIAARDVYARCESR